MLALNQDSEMNWEVNSFILVNFAADILIQIEFEVEFFCLAASLQMMANMYGKSELMLRQYCYSWIIYLIA